MRRANRPVLFRLAVPLVCAAATACAAGERLYPGSVELPKSPYITRLVDDLTGAPLAGVEVFLVSESDTPLGGEFVYEAKATSDAEGFVRIPIPGGGEGNYMPVVRSPGRVASRFGWDPVWRVGRGCDVPVRVLDWLGRPAPGAVVGFCGGCGHTPDLADAVADASGVATLRGVDPENGIADLYVQHPGLDLFYDMVDWRPGEPARVARCDFSPAIRGTLVDHLGRPVAGAYIDAGSVHRGPFARTAADGSFTVLGAARDSYPHRVVLPGGRQVHFPTSFANPVTLTLPDLSDPQVYEGAISPIVAEHEPTATREVAVTVRGATGGVELATVFPDQPSSRDVHVEDGHVLLPVAGPFVLVVTPGEESATETDRRYAFADAAAIGSELVVDWIPAVRVSGRVVDPAGRPIAAKVRVLRPFEQSDEVAFVEGPDGTFEVPCETSGTRMLEITPDATPDRVRRAWIVVPQRGERAILPVGDLVVGAPPQLRVVGADAATRVGFARVGWQEAGDSHAWPLATDGAWQGPDLRAGDAIVVEREGWLTFRCPLIGEGPWTVTLPSGEITFEIVDAAGSPCAATIVVADHGVSAIAGQATLRGLPSGSHRVWISAPGMRTAILDVEGEAVSRARVVLQPRN